MILRHSGAATCSSTSKKTSACIHIHRVHLYHLDLP
jgi:hypothetical protein